ncbi:asparagine synthase-related protein [Halomonas sp. RT37]|uniref:Asparagine synthase-related protein n=1 Tax=Halomonas sp. RT37 TaxID=2950872 RepID=A0AAU7KLZ9_9GAMM
MSLMRHKYFDHLGARSYFVDKRDAAVSYSHIANALIDGGVIDPAAVLGVLMKNYILSDRTLVQGVKRTPWLSRKNEEGKWQYAELPKHGSVRCPPDIIATKLKERLRDEALSFLQGKKKIGILLSGGMDSRVVAAVVKNLQDDGLYTGEVVALTWGIDESRDVVYSQRIAESFNWEFRHFPVNASVLKKNIHIAADRGAEYSPVHLHAMSSVSQTDGIDGILAGSYGDSIGRGEYSGRKVRSLPSILSKNVNHFSFMLCSAEHSAQKTILEDLANDRARYPGRSEASYREIEMQLHYMRRQLNSCMEVIDDRIPVYQMFSDPNVFGFMWSLHPSCRTDRNYECLLQILSNKLLDLPWARTGVRYNENGSNPEDDLKKLNNCYGKWLRTDLRDFVIDEISSGALKTLGIFNERSLDMWVRHWPSSTKSKADRLDEKMAWLASLSLFVKKYNIQGISPPARRCSTDWFAEKKAFIHTQLYHATLGVLKR